MLLTAYATQIFHNWHGFGCSFPCPLAQIYPGGQLSELPFTAICHAAAHLSLLPINAFPAVQKLVAFFSHRHTRLKLSYLQVRDSMSSVGESCSLIIHLQMCIVIISGSTKYLACSHISKASTFILEDCGRQDCSASAAHPQRCTGSRHRHCLLPEIREQFRRVSPSYCETCCL